MTVLTANEALQGLLNGVKSPAEIRDAHGNLLGYFTPPGQAEDLLYERAKAQIDLEEVKRRRLAGREGYTYEQVKQHLQSLEKRP